MHFLREGQFAVASTFLDEAHENPPQPIPTPGTPNPYSIDDGELSSLKSKELQSKFSHMYTILRELRNKNLSLAIEWAKENSRELETRAAI